MCAYGDVAHFLRRALDFATEPGEHRASLCENLAYALYICGDATESTVWLEKAVSQYQALGNRHKTAQMLLHAARQRWLNVHTTESLELARRALAEVDHRDTELRFATYVTVARFCAMLSMTGEAFEHLEAARKIKGIHDANLIAAFHDVLGIVEGNLGKIDSALDNFDKATTTVAGSEDPEAMILAWNNYGYLASWLGKCDLARSCYDRALAIATGRGYVMRTAFVSLGYARTLMRFGMLAEAKVLLDGAISSGVNAPIITLLLAEVGIPLGLMLDNSELLSYCARAEALELALQSGEPERIGPVALAFADYAAVQGDILKSKAILKAALGALKSADQCWWMLSRVALTCDSTEMHEAHQMLMDAVNRVPQHLAAQACLHLFEAYAARRSGDVKRSVASATRAANMFEEMQWRPLLAEALEVARRSNDALKIREEIGDIRFARRLESAKARRSGGERRGSKLTPREQDVAGLVSKGMTSKEIAEELGISEHTVIHHLESAYDRLGIRSRAQLTAIIVGNSKVKEDGFTHIDSRKS